MSTLTVKNASDEQVKLWNEAQVLKPFTPAHKNVLFQIMLTLHVLIIHLGFILFVNLSGGTVPQEVNFFLLTVASVFFGWNLYLLFTGALRKAVIGTVLLNTLSTTLEEKFKHSQILARNNTNKAGIILDVVVVTVIAIQSTINPDLTFIPIIGAIYTGLGAFVGLLNIIGNSAFIKTFDTVKEELLTKYSQKELDAVAEQRKQELSEWYNKDNPRVAIAKFLDTAIHMQETSQQETDEEKKEELINR